MVNNTLVSSLKSCLGHILPHYPVNLAYLFGSAATGQNTPLSDVDIALVLTAEMITPGQQLSMELKLAEEISRHCAITDVDVRIINTAPLMLRGDVITQGILLYCTDEPFRIAFETSTRSEYFDFLPTAAQIQQGYLDRLLERGLNG